MPGVFFRCDAGPVIGMGHLTRCQALAAAFADMGWRCWFAVSRETGPLLPDTDPIIVPEGDAGAAAVAEAAVARNIGCLVVDHYGLDARFEGAIAGAISTILAIDDLPNRPHRCDLLVDANPARRPADYAKFTPHAAHLLLGPRHALLRPEFAVRRAVRRSPPRTAERLLITLGGADPDNVSARVLDALAYLDGKRMNACLVIGPANRHRDDLTARAAAFGCAVAIDPPDLDALMADSDIAITSGGTSALECACLGVPALVIVTADNQRAVAHALADAETVMVMEDGEHLDPRRLAGAVIGLADDPALRRRMRSAGRNLIDGQGAARVARATAEVLTIKQQGKHL
jgi:UDP-2,4-diacetamido-2,4,6-trideoxy-beta-L-altropyranose hydrolase